ncbi:bifunctional DNA-binding transcriptional regulator/O6-methylguanine-DNA methyltransferase Ada [Phototrophicus methaneseepsis]|uniref:Methylated-DNA--protein-cysteine methyltransferase n=1 Tax=Phototrophicus methaneseepsis TaxID=2710758 RepID=A0A7S8E9N8_9CHLR|nr:bifunctional DNA-binding transcriptional regulator/O6-methylguanine-DNA methyltransferase Ada [Phototrophicus methaneseepsis]QPC82942.1 bifunctional DNA-binding transcriptional regulator/O6-methylguanine-DNA methyltransferase Ada [Phototrophicus methaneseepsis]
MIQEFTLDLTEDVCYKAVANGDPAYDGQFVVAVKTTGIYCRPSCPARTPKRENVEFFPLPAAAECNGYRPCKRCNPRQHDMQDEQARRVQIICDYITEHLDADLSLEALAQQVHLSPYYFQRTFKQMMGITPRQYAEAKRMDCLKEHLRDGLSVTDAVYEVGFGASSRMYERADAHLGMTPTTYRNKGEDMTIVYTIVNCPLGRMLIAATERGICKIDMRHNDEELVARLIEEFPKATIANDDDAMCDYAHQIVAHLNGWQPHLDLPIDIRVTAFQQRVLSELQRIPYGETRSYKQIAEAIGNPRAARAVGNACNANPVPILIPCHRVIHSDGGITGYAFGPEVKKQILDTERENKPE